MDVEVLAVLRKRWLAGDLSDERFQLAVGDLLELRIGRHPMLPTVRRAVELRDNVTPYDVVYVALAEVLTSPLLTADRRLARAPGPQCERRLVQHGSGQG